MASSIQQSVRSDVVQKAACNELGMKSIVQERASFWGADSRQNTPGTLDLNHIISGIERL
jgi:hypothetical protein